MIRTAYKPQTSVIAGLGDDVGVDMASRSAEAADMGAELRGRRVDRVGDRRSVGIL